jgi:membrane peptidoglycan carboxypeptidase
MVKSGFLSAAERDGLRYPETLPRDTVFSRNKELRNGWQGVLGAKVENELRKIIPERQLYTGGYTVTTTLDHTLQNRAAAAARSALTGQDKRMSAAVVAVAPDSGKVRAYYGGEAGFGNFDPVGSPHPTGASFKPYLLAAELTAGRFPSYPGPDNLGVYVQSEKLDLASAARLAGDAGITAINGHAPRTRQAIRTIATGQPAVTVLDQAAGYATIASGGVARQPYLIETVTAPDGTVVWRHDRAKTPAKRAFDARAGELTSIVLQKSYLSLPRDDGLSLARDDGVSLPLDDGPVQELGGQSGSADGNTDAWMCGFSPSLATAVWIGGTGDAFPLRDAATGKLIGGSSLPSNIFLEVMDPSDGRIARPTK